MKPIIKAESDCPIIPLLIELLPQKIPINIKIVKAKSETELNK